MLKLQVNMATSKASSKAVPVVFGHFDVPENVDGNFKAKCKHYSTSISGSTKARFHKGN